MARRSRGGGNGRRRRRRRSGGSGKEALWALGLGLAIIVVVLVAEFVAENPTLAMAIALLAIAAFLGGLFLRYRAIQARRMQFLAANAELAKVDLMTGPQFEHLIAERMIAEGFRRVRERGRAGDGGVDITAVAPGGTPYAIQCKRYTNTVGAPEVRNFLGALANAFDGHTGVLVTSGRLTRQARTEALNARQNLVLVERDRLADWLLGRNILLPKQAPLVEGEEPAS
ncbi:restriction endonuclease [Nonomuraea candida]|uniref:restriction endonuclease n=1 Tax=Nonomuraea candida TaxID=359159 RepID=UPI000693E621|nr:restriction endonuclease [Nonomuraea candida]